MRNNIFTLLCVAFSSPLVHKICSFVQVFETQSLSKGTPVKPRNGGSLYNDDNCISFYSLWVERGDISFAFHNAKVFMYHNYILNTSK